MLDSAEMSFVFQSTLPVRGATNQLLNNVSCSSFQSTPPVRGATLRYTLPLRQIDISIHAPRAGGDGLIARSIAEQFMISIHAPRAGGDAYPPCSCRFDRDFNPRPPCGGRLEIVGLIVTVGMISIHAPRAGGDPIPIFIFRIAGHISIHAPRAGGDA